MVCQLWCSAAAGRALIFAAAARDNWGRAQKSRKIKESRSDSVPRQLHQRVIHVIRLRKDFVLHLRLIRNKGVFGGDPLHRSVEVVEQLIRDAGSDFGAVAQLSVS